MKNETCHEKNEPFPLTDNKYSKHTEPIFLINCFTIDVIPSYRLSLLDKKDTLI